jgi:uncharacterized oxidoreductase
MKTSKNTVLITGGSTGIGLALAEGFLAEDNEVIICARTEATLKSAKEKFPKLEVTKCDVAKENQREALFTWVIGEFPDTNILVNNAGIQKRIDFKNGPADLLKARGADGQDEIDVNLKATVYLTALFVPDFMKKKEAAVINVGSGLGFIPIARMPIYCATKAAIHSLSISLRHQLKDTSVKVFELIPPTVDTNLDKGARAAAGQKDRGIPPVEVAKALMKALSENDYEVGVGMAANIKKAASANFDEMFGRMNH